MRPWTLTLTLALIGATTPVHAAKKDDAGADPNKVVCRPIRSVGSNIPKRECATRAEWEVRDKAKEETRKAQGTQAPPTTINN